jgi:hypothetical protein
MSSPASLLLTAVVSLAIGAGGTYALVRVEATCNIAKAAAPTVPPVTGHFFDAPAPAPDWSKRY